eukprot:365661-Chlamydomonas_euryale.AAC.32
MMRLARRAWCSKTRKTVRSAGALAAAQLRGRPLADPASSLPLRTVFSGVAGRRRSAATDLGWPNGPVMRVARERVNVFCRGAALGRAMPRLTSFRRAGGTQTRWCEPTRVRSKQSRAQYVQTRTEVQTTDKWRACPWVHLRRRRLRRLWRQTRQERETEPRVSITSALSSEKICGEGHLADPRGPALRVASSVTFSQSSKHRTMLQRW